MENYKLADVIESNNRLYAEYRNAKNKPVKKEIDVLYKDQLRHESKCFVVLDQSGNLVRFEKYDEKKAKQLEEKRQADKQKQKTENTSASTSNQASSSNLNNSFYNPYYFIPMPKRETEDENFGDYKPPSHGKFHSDLYNGKLRVKMTVETPLLIPDAQNRVKDLQREHYTYATREIDGKPYIPPTTVKGMLRSAFEAITNSRMGVFNQYDDVTGFRPGASGATEYVPVRIENVKGNLKARLLMGNKQYNSNGAAYAILVKSYKKLTKEPLGQLPENGSKIWFKNEYKDSKSIAFYVDINNVTTSPQSGNGWKEGYFCRTGPNMDNKMSERIFYSSSGSSYADLTDELEKQWKNLISNYQKIHEVEIEKKKNKYPPALKNSNCRWSRYITGSKDECELKEGTLCYAEVEKVGNAFKVKALYPV
ncbi:MAG: RAMP superfamily CRISPR-associated protein, partial [Armatimonadota bacterium]